MNTGHNSNAQLRSIIERIEDQEAEKKAIADGIKDIYAEAKGAGFDPGAIRDIIRMRKQDTEKRKERESTVEMYLAALGDFATSPLGQAAMARATA